MRHTFAILAVLSVVCVGTYGQQVTSTAKCGEAPSRAFHSWFARLAVGIAGGTHASILVPCERAELT